MTEAIGVKPEEVYMARNLLCVFDFVGTVLSISLAQEKVKELDGLLLCITVRGKDAGCVSLSFAKNALL